MSVYKMIRAEIEAIPKAGVCVVKDKDGNVVRRMRPSKGRRVPVPRGSRRLREGKEQAPHS